MLPNYSFHKKDAQSEKAIFDDQVWATPRGQKELQGSSYLPGACFL